MNKIQIITVGCILYIAAPPMSEGQLCASRVINGLFGRFYQDGGPCSWYNACPDIEDICSTCSFANQTAADCPVERCLVYLANHEAYGNRCGNTACDNVAQCMSCISKCRLSEIGVVVLPSVRLYYSPRLGYFYRQQN